MTPQPGTTTLEFGGRTFLLESWTLDADPYRRLHPETLTIRAVLMPAAPTPPPVTEEPEPLSFLWW